MLTRRQRLIILYICIMYFVVVMVLCNKDRVHAMALPSNIEDNQMIFRNKLVKTKNTKPMVIIRKIDKPQPISLDFNVFKNCGYSRDELIRSLSSSNHKQMILYVDTFLEAEKKYGVNAFYLMCKLGLESGWCRYRSGVNNIAGWTNGRGGYKDFNSVESCIMHVAKTLSTFYKNKVGVRLEDVCSLYCPDQGYVYKVMQIMSEQKQKI